MQPEGFNSISVGGASGCLTTNRPMRLKLMMIMCTYLLYWPPSIATRNAKHLTIERNLSSLRRTSKFVFYLGR